MLVLGHRGEPRLAPENTVASFALIRDDLDHGIDGAECDVQMTKDGELVVIHDEKVDRTTDGNGWVKDLTLQEIRKFDAGVRFPGPLHHEPIPTMREVFEVFDGTRATVNVELKNSEVPYAGMEERLLELASRYSLNVIYSSFNIQSMGVIRKLSPKARTGLLYAPWLIRAPDVVAAAREQGANAIHPFVLNTLDGLIREVHEAGLAIAPWTVDLSVLVRHFVASGVETVISNDPRMAAEAVAGERE
ncbi:MAG TPA: glycerophosphodiester phosphodiesterase family protein [Candidatus Deferrimicrobium sp.]|nr:glycerophosphodiester phosphodiesterase family protein [Candidatus Deferrimicrobium sp.]